MRARRAALLLAAALALLAGSAAAQGDYYPAQPGLSWTYDNGETQTLAGRRAVGGVVAVAKTHLYDGVPVSEEFLEHAGPDVGVRSHGVAAGGEVVRYDPPLVVYPAAPLRPGDVWESATVADGVEITMRAEVLGPAGVVVPAGRFNALRIRRTTRTDTGGRTVVDAYFVPSVGVVRYVTADGTRVDLIELAFDDGRDD